MKPQSDYDPLRRYGCSALIALFLAFLGGCAMLLTGCARTHYIPVESTRTEYRDREVERIMSDTVRDTRLVWVRGDTVVDIRQKERIHRIQIHDTCYIEHRDTIRLPYPVEKNLTRWEQTKQDYGGEAIIVLAVIIIVAAVWLIKKFRK